ncbi:ABC transporter permease [Chelatococcus sp. SYSU_G07232]|uniref:ABC transporter permease n=1 Tax=Chelatococcus albus TaxID=3047466 RepID=A0ABT7AEU6_9HYPH|nr:ABC transporter permease [Chelatococcus sp. SYSU_G07232]MDJ1157630.1 ABC transporter permease [Chelatococcus sp. SYSU_G07232]
MDIGRNSQGFTLLVGLLFAFLLAPVLFVFPISFSNDPFLAFPPQSWGFKYFAALPRNAVLMSAFRTSLALAATVTALSLALAVPAAYALVRLDFRGRDWLMSLFTAPLLLPSIVLGLAILLVFVRVDLLATYPGLVIAHLVVTLPYALRVIATALGTLPPAIEDAAATLGAPPFTVFRRVTLPMMMPGIVAASALSFLVSFDEVVISLFIVGPKLSTFPVEMFRYVETRTDPLIAAASVILIVATIGIVLVLERSIGVARALGKASQP